CAQARHDGAAKIFGLVDAEDRRANARNLSASKIGISGYVQGLLPFPPLAHVSLVRRVKTFNESRPHIEPGPGNRRSKPKCEDKRSRLMIEVQFRSQGNVAVRRRGKFPAHATVLPDILPSIRIPAVTG